MKTGTITPDVLRKIVIEEMDLDDERVYIYNPNFKLPTDMGLFVVIRFNFSKSYSNRNSAQGQTGALVEYQSVNTVENYTISLMSRDLSAIQRKEEIAMALRSVFSQQSQESNSFKIFQNMPMHDVSEVEGAARIFRFDIDVNVLAWYSKSKAPSYYDSFTGKVLVDQAAAHAVEKDFTQT